MKMLPGRRCALLESDDEIIKHGINTSCAALLSERITGDGGVAHGLL
jgi:hypothetical protein